MTQEAEASAEAEIAPDDAFMEENDEEDLSAEVAQEPSVTSQKVLRLASAGTGIQTGQHIFYGEQKGAITGYSYALPTSLFGDGDERFLHYWRVLDPKKGNYGGNNMLVISEALWSGSDGQGIMFDAGTEAQNYEDRSNNWLNSDAEQWCFGLCQSNLFDDIERSSITKFVKDDPTNDSYGACRLTSYDQIFFLSADEAQTYFPEINGASAGEKLKVTYFMAREGYTVSAIICDDDTKEILYYGKLKETN